MSRDSTLGRSAPSEASEQQGRYKAGDTHFGSLSPQRLSCAAKERASIGKEGVNVASWLRVLKKSGRSTFLKQCFKNGDFVESILLEARLIGTIVAQNLSAPTFSTASATSRHPAARNRGPLTGWPEAVTRLRLPQNVACGFLALRSSERASQHSEYLELPVWQGQAWSL